MADTYDLTTSIGKVRLLIGDTDIADTQFSDDEISAFLALEPDSLRLAAALALESWAASASESAESEKIGDYAYTKKLAGNKLALAARYREAEALTPALTWAEFDFSAVSDTTEEE